ncbi:MAG: hypothetical protein K2Q06_16240 [Parvularculaceae bacterium]|nr:hypothetical protein [Parvularculaceae bacterium]
MRRALLTMTAMAAAGAATGCATLTPAASIEQRLVTLGLSRSAAQCFATGLDDRLETDDLRGVARFLDGIRPNRSAEKIVESLGGIDNPRAAKAIASTAISCALGGRM